MELPDRQELPKRSELPEFGLFTDFSEVIDNLDEEEKKIRGMNVSDEMKMSLLRDLALRRSTVMFGKTMRKNMMDSILRCLVVIFLLMYTR
jgi:hypothetical protein